MKLGAIDGLIIAAYMFVIAYIGWRTRRFAGQNLENYFLGGRSMPGWMTGLSYAASMMSADSAVAYGGLAAVTGVYVCWFYLSRFGIALFLGAVLFAVYWKRLNTFTTLEFYELRFEGRPAAIMRVWLAVRTSLIAMVAWTGISLLALVKIGEPILGWSKTEILLLAIPLAIGSVYLAGYVGVVLSNIVQIAVMAVGSILLAVKALIAAGGPAELARSLTAAKPEALSLFPPLSDPVFPVVACVAWLLGTSIGYGGDAAPMGAAVEGQRILSTRSPKEACKMYVVTEITLFTLVWLVSVPCLAASIFWPGLRTGALDRELAYGMLMTHYLGRGLLGLVFVAMLGGIISVVGDNLNFGSQVLLNDLYRRYLVKGASEKHYFIAGRLAIFIILALALLVVYRVNFLFDVAIFMVGLSASEMSGNWAQWWWWRFNGWGRVAASFGGGLCYIAMRLIWPGMAWWNRMYAAIGLSTILWIAVTLVTAPERRELLDKFYLRAQPLGFWGPLRGAGSTKSGSIPAGVIVAITGAIAVMAYIVAISCFYVGRNGAGGVLLGAMALCGVMFWLTFDKYIRTLLSPQELSELNTSAHGPSRTAEMFGWADIGAVIAFAMSTVMTLTAALFVDGEAAVWNLLGAGIAAAVGVWCGRRRKAGDSVEEPGRLEV